MQNPNSPRSAYDTDYDNDSWLGQKERSFSSKLLIAVGGITSFGGLFPALVDKLSTLWGNGDSDVGVGFFILFSIGYFVLPLIMLVVWSWISDRVAYPERDLSLRAGWKLKDWLQSPITYRYQWLVGIQALVVLLYLVLSIAWLKPTDKWMSLGLGLWLVVVPFVAMFTFSRRTYPSQKLTRKRLWIAFIVATVLVGGYLTLKLNFQEHKGARLSDYDKLVQVDRIGKQLAILEKDVTNRVDRFFLKSSVQAQVTLDSVKTVNLPKGLNLSDYYIDPSLKTLGRFLLEDDNWNSQTVCEDSVYCHRQHSLTLPNVKVHPQHLFIDFNDVDSCLVPQDISLIDLMRSINNLILDMEDSERHRVFSSCFDSVAVVGPVLADSLKATLNLRNSRKLKDWVENFYLPYCQRKAKSDIEKIAEQTAWIWQDMQLRGLAISVANLALLLLFYLELIDLKSSKIFDLEKGKRQEEDEKERDARTAGIESLNKKADYLLFPLSMALTIIGLLLVPVTSQMEISGLTPSRSFWMMNVPSLHLPEVMDQVVSETPKPQPTSLEDPSKEEPVPSEPNVPNEPNEPVVPNKDTDAPGNKGQANADNLTNEVKNLNDKLEKLNSTLKARKDMEPELKDIGNSLKGIQSQLDSLPKKVGTEGWGIKNEPEKKGK